MQLAEQLPKGHELTITSIAYDQARAVVFVGAEHPDIKAWSMRNAIAPLAVMKGHKGNVSSLVFCDGLHVLISGALDGLCIVWDERYKVVQVCSISKYSCCAQRIVLSTLFDSPDMTAT